MLAFFLILAGSFLLLFILQKQKQGLAVSNTLFSDSFIDATSLSANWPELGSVGTGVKASSQWNSSGYDASGGSIYTLGTSDGTPLPGMTQPVANVIAVHPINQYLQDGVYEIRGAFMTKDINNLGAYQLMVMFEHNNWTYQATFHYRKANWSQMPAPNNNPAGIYIYDYNDKPVRLGSLYYPSKNNQWVTIKGTFDTSKMEYVSIEVNGQKYSTSGIKLAKTGSDLYGNGTRQGQIHLSTAGKVGALKVSGYYDIISFIYNSPLAPTSTPTPTPINNPATPTPTSTPTPTLTPTPTATKAPTPTPTNKPTPTPTPRWRFGPF
ncbi:MAG: hypothetical protein Q8Q24_00500 [bacterium]|nr:hypothetical protein [bacterium]